MKNTTYTEQELETLLESVSDAVYSGDKESLKRCNENALKLFECEDLAELNKTVPFISGKFNVLDYETNEILDEKYYPFALGLEGELIDRRLILVSKKLEIELYVRVRVCPVLVNSKIVGAVAILTDFTKDVLARRKIASALKKHAEISTLAEKLENYSYAVAHDLKSPLTNIQALSSALIEDYKDELPKEALMYLEVIYESSQRMGDYVLNLLALSNVNSATLEKEEVNASLITKKIISQSFLNEKYKNYKFDIKDNILIYGDRNLLISVIENILYNAVKFSAEKENPHIIFGQLFKENEVVYYIKDNGIGFPPELKTEIFKFKTKINLSNEFEGHGIGLNTVQHIVNSHGGRIWAESETGKGAIFYFVLPEKKED